MTLLRTLILVSLAGTTASAATLPGFRVETLAHANGFVSSVVTDSNGIIYFTTTDGWIQRVDGTESTKIAALPTHAGGNGGLLGMALLDDHTAVVHYTTWDGEGELAKVLDDVVSRVDLTSGAETVMHSFVCDIESRSRGASSEHHGGNPAIGPDGAVFLGIGEYGGHLIAQRPEWNGGKVWRIDRDGSATQWALGMRNPYDVAWDPELQRVVVTDNGENGGDEVNVIAEGSNCGWPNTYGTHAPMEGAVEPVYVFEQTVAPTGLARLSGANPMLRRGYLSGAFVTRSVYYFPSVVPPVARAIPLVSSFAEFVIDVTEAPNGDVIFATAAGATSSIQRLSVPVRGDCNGDGTVDWRDVYALVREVNDGGPHPAYLAQDGAYAASWGCDVNLDGTIDANDVTALSELIGSRRRAVR